MKKILKKAGATLSKEVVSLPLYGGLKTAWRLREEEGQFTAAPGCNGSRSGGGGGEGDQ